MKLVHTTEQNGSENEFDRIVFRTAHKGIAFGPAPRPVGITLSFLTANIMIPPARAVGVFFTIERVCSPCKRADGLSMMGCFQAKRSICVTNENNEQARVQASAPECYKNALNVSFQTWAICPITNWS